MSDRERSSRFDRDRRDDDRRRERDRDRDRDKDRDRDRDRDKERSRDKDGPDMKRSKNEPGPRDLAAMAAQMPMHLHVRSCNAFALLHPAYYCRILALSTR